MVGVWPGHSVFGDSENKKFLSLLSGLSVCVHVTWPADMAGTEALPSMFLRAGTHTPER